ncbi:DNA cytosine methyltransferase [Lactococcus lactis]|uniref:DNA cytosine methyltransferase n=1 Tax=Lactococcus lactis TaxID=1358 RepID=UPI003D0AB6F2
MKFLDLFAGIGGFRLGLEKAGHECVGFCEIDKFARQSYKAIHNTEGEREYHDITTVSNEEWRTLRGTVELICGGFPCQAFSIAGKRKGFLDETRGTLFFEIARAAEQIKPRTLFLENVRGLLSHDKGRTFRTIISTLDELGYDAEWQILNSKNFGVPQNRERVFIIGHLRGERGREVFPIRESNSETDDGLKIKIVGNTNNAGHGQKSAVYSADGIMSCLTATDYKQPKQIVVLNKEKGMPRETNRVYSSEGLSPTLNTMQGGGREPKIAIPVLTPDRAEKRQNGRRFKENGEPMFTLIAQDRHGVAVKEATKQGYAIAEQGDSINFSVPNSKTRRGRVGKQVAQTLDTSCNQATITKDMRIRKLTPRECWRLQGFPDWAFDKAQEVNSNSQLYKQAGNSVTVPVIYEMARRFE